MSYFLKKIFILSLIGQFFSQAMLFEGMTTSINQQLISFAHIIPDRAKIQQLQYSVFSQLQNAQKFGNIINTIDLITTNVKKGKEITQEAQIMFTMAVVSHALSLIAKKLYVSIAKIRFIVHYWKKIDRYSLVHYLISHSPFVWNIKLQGNFQIKQKIIMAHDVYKKYISYLGNIAQLVQHIPEHVQDDNCIQWINDALLVMNHCSGNKQLKKIENNFNPMEFLLSFKSFLETFEKRYNAHFLKEKQNITIPTYVQRSFGKMALTAVTLIGTALFTWYNAAKMVGWYNSGYTKITDLVKGYIINPAQKAYNTVFFEKKNQEDPKKIAPGEDFSDAYSELIDDFKELKKEFKEQVEIWTPTSEDDELFKQQLIEFFKESEGNHDFIDNITKKHDLLELQRQAERLKNNAWIKKSEQRFLSTLPLYFKVLARGAPKHLYKTLEKLTKLLKTLVKIVQSKDKQIEDLKEFVIDEVYEVKKDFEAIRLLAILTPTIFTGLGSGFIAKKLYNFFTTRDYSALKRAFKELETTTICSIKTPNNDENYGMFIFLLEVLKLGVDRITNSRYTMKDELLEDLKRLESPDLSFEQRYKLIGQIKESYIIFK